MAVACLAVTGCQLLFGLEPKELAGDVADAGDESTVDSGDVFIPPPEPADCHDVDPKYASARFRIPGDGPDGTSYTVDEAAGVVTDKTTGLMWQRKTGLMPRAEATCACTQLVLAGYTDWRLPSFAELITIVDYAKNPDPNGTGTTQPAINLAVFPDTEIDAYWTTTSRTGDLKDLYAIDFIDGRVIQFTDMGLGQSYFRCVRTATPPPEIGSRFAVTGGTANDAYTGLTWARDSSPTKLTYAQSAGYCAGLKVDGAGGFRLATIKELVGLVDPNLKNYPHIDKTAFPNPKQESIFSATRYAADPTGQSWKVSLGDGVFFRGIADDPTYAMCLKGP